MANLRIDTTVVSNVVANIRTENANYQLAVDNFFKEIENLFDCWNGPDAEKFVAEVLSQKNDLDKLKLIFDDYADAIQKQATRIDMYNYFQG